MITTYEDFLDMYVLIWLKMYYWPYFVAGNVDDWCKMGITLNGIRPR